MGGDGVISEEYAEQNRLLHQRQAKFGYGGGQYAGRVYGLIATWQPKTVLDYGCGKGGLELAVRSLAANGSSWRPINGKKLRIYVTAMPEWFSYDPAIPGRETIPDLPCDMLVCTDVLEHVETEFIEETMATLARLTGKVALLTIGLRKSNKTLPDGRNAHLIIKDREWWRDLIGQHFAHRVDLPWRRQNVFMVAAFQ